MKTKTEDVKSARKNKEEPKGSGKWFGPDGTPLANGDVRVVVGSTTYNVYDSLDEARKMESDAECLRLINAGVETEAKNSKRAESVGVKSDRALREDAYQTLVSTDEGIAAIRATHGDKALFEALMKDTIEQLKSQQGTVEVDEVAEPVTA